MTFKLLAVSIAALLWLAYFAARLQELKAEPVRLVLDKFSRLGWINRVAVLFIVVQLTMFGGAKHGGTNDVTNVDGTNVVTEVSGTNEVEGVDSGEAYPPSEASSEGGAMRGVSSPLQRTGLRGPFLSGRPSQSLTSGEDTSSPLLVTNFIRGYRLESVATNDDISYTMPSEGEVRGTWHLTGACEDVMKVGLGDFRFPLGTNLCDSLWAYTWGKTRPRLKNITNEIEAVGVPMSAIPDVSRFWTAATTNDTYLLTWENFAHGRIPASTNTLSLIPHPSSLVSAQLELSKNGDFITRSNSVETVYRRVNPDDWDDDGIPNDVDADPLTGAEYPQFGPHQTLLEGRETNYLYWVDLVVRQANARVVFEGDGSSDFADPTFVAKAGETNRVYLLIGKTYSVSCPMPLECVGKEDDEVEVSPSGNGLYIRWDIRLEFVQAMPLQTGPSLLGATTDDGGTRAQIHPGRAGGGSFTWPGSFCCYNYDADGAPVFNCHGNCGCIGYCHTGAITYTYVGYSRDFDGWTCSCTPSGDDEDPDGGDEDPEDPPTVGYATASFSKRAIIFEDEYEPAEGVTVPRRSTESRLTCFAYGGESGGAATFEVEGDERLVTVSGRTLPFTQRVGPNEDYEVEIVYQGKRGPGGQVRVTASFASNDPDEHVDDSVANLDVVEIEIMRQVGAPDNDCIYRHKFGVGEKINCNHYPSGVNFRWDSTTGNNVNARGEYMCPLFAASNPLSAICGDAIFTPTIQVVKPTGIEARQPECVTYDIPAGRAGWVGLRQEFYVTPLDVSFSNIAMEEVPSTDGHRDGYFDDPAFYVLDCHSFALGAGKWLKVNDDNQMGVDTTRLTLELQRVDNDGNFTDNTAYQWRTGWITWEIPFAWAAAEIADEGSSAQLIEQFDPQAGARFDIAPNGDVTVTKFGNAAKREISATFKLNGVICMPVH